MCNLFKPSGMVTYNKRSSVYHFTCGNLNVRWVTLVLSVIMQIGLIVLIGLEIYALISGNVQNDPIAYWEHPLIRLVFFVTAFISSFCLMLGNLFQKPFLYQPSISLLRLLVVVFMALLVFEFANIVIKLNNTIDQDMSKIKSLKSAQINAVKSMIKTINLIGYFGVSIVMLIALNICAKDELYIRKIKKVQQEYHTVPQNVNRNYQLNPSNEYDEHCRASATHVSYESGVAHFEKNVRSAPTVVV